MLELRRIGLAEGVAKREGDEERSGRLDFHSVLTHHDKADGAEAGGLEDACQHTDRVRAQRSGGSEEHHFHAFVLQRCATSGPVSSITRRVAYGAHKGVMLRCAEQ